VTATDTHLIIAGQSNVGYGTDTASLIGYVPTARVQIWNPTANTGHGAWEYLHPGFNASGLPTQPGSSGFAVREAQDWLAAHSTGNLWIIQEAHGSTGLAQDASQFDWSPHSTGEMFDQATNAISTAMHNLDGSPYAFTHWDKAQLMEGETDACDQAKAAAYDANEREFITDARAAWHVQEFDAEWNLDNGSSPMADVHTFKTIGFEMQPDGIHYDSAGQVALGDAFFTSTIW
jgi:hypothetical protein